MADSDESIKNREEKERERKNQLRLTIIATASSLISAILVALLTYDSSIKIAAIQADTQIKMQETQIQTEQRKFESDQLARKDKFISENLPKLLSPNEVDRKIANSMLLFFYPDDAKNILGSLAASSTGENKIEYERASAEAEAYNKKLGSWIIVAGGYPSLEAATDAIADAKKLGIESMTIYKKTNSYRLTIGSFPSREDAERLNIAVRAKLLDTAYIVNLGDWCPQHIEKKESDTIYLECT